MVMNSIKINDIDVSYGSLMELEDRLVFWSAFDGSDEFTSFLHHSKDKKTLLDIGCSYGAFGLAFAKSDSSKSAHCFDGSINAWLSLTQTIELNKLQNIKCHRALIGDFDGRVGIAYDKHQSFFNTNSNLTDLMLQVDTLCELFNLEPDCMKIDTEGAEYRVLVGAKETIKAYKPTLFMEVHPRFLQFHKNTIYDVLNIFNEINYTALDLFGNPIDNYKKCLEEEQTDSHRSVWVPNQ